MTDLNAPDTFIENGQLYLHFLPNSLINNEIRRYNIKTNRQYREYLQNNAPQIINHNFISYYEYISLKDYTEYILDQMKQNNY